MSSTESLVGYDPAELIFPLELNRQLSSSIRLLNKTENFVFYKLLTTCPRKYGVRPRIGVLLPGSACDITVTTRLKEAPRKLKSKDWFMIQSAVAHLGATVEDARWFMFNRNGGPVLQESKLRVVYSRPGSSGIENSPNVPEVASPGTGPDDNVTKHTSLVKFLDVQPPELNVPSNPETDYSCLLKLSNVTADHVAFKVNTMSQKYIVQPHMGSLSPQSTCDITVKMQVVPSDVQSEDKFLVQSMVSAAAVAMEDVQDMFDNTSTPIQECELPVIAISKEEQDADAQADELFLRGIVICLLGLFSCYVMKQMLPWIRSLTMLGVWLMIEMIKRLAWESVEEWVLKTLIYVIKSVWAHAIPLIFRGCTSKFMARINIQ